MRSLSALALLGAAACGPVPVDPGPRIFPAQGVIRGTVVYQGPHPCSSQGHIVGNAIVLVFDRRNPPPPNGVASTAVNFGDVTGDVLFGNEPRYAGADVYCPAEVGFTETITASAPFDVAPLAGGSYEIHAFFDSTGNFLPEFQIRDGPERGDVAGGAIDTTDAFMPINVGNPDYQPIFLPIDVGVAQPLSPGAAPGAIPDFVIPSDGFVADNVTVTIGAPLNSTRPYFYAQGLAVAFDGANPGALSASVAQSSDQPATDETGIGGAAESDPNSLPILTIPQDVAVLAPPIEPTPANVDFLESTFPHLRLQWGVPSAEQSSAIGSPFNMQVAPFVPGQLGAGFLVWQNATLDAATQQYEPQQIPEGNNVPQLWPLVVLSRMADGQSGSNAPPVVIQGITLLGATAAPDSLFGTVAAGVAGSLFGPGGAAGPWPIVTAQDHVTVLVRPSAICFGALSDPTQVDKRGTLVTPHPLATSADLDCSTSPCTPAGTPGQAVLSAEALSQLGALVSTAVTGCLPMGRYAISAVYPDGQAWTVPNEAGACSGSEGATDYASLTCTLKPRPVLYSQGNRAVVEVVSAQDPSYCAENPVPDACGNGM